MEAVITLSGGNYGGYKVDKDKLTIISEDLQTNTFTFDTTGEYVIIDNGDSVYRIVDNVGVFVGQFQPEQ